jgi:pimeloyl-ACP methyl ester carboxylesterase
MSALENASAGSRMSFSARPLWRWLSIGLLLIGPAAWSRSMPAELTTRTGTLHGTLELPAGKGPFPVALLIAGSGPTDRNGNDSLLGLNTNCYRLLALSLRQHGIASLRYDKRGAGQDFLLALPESHLRFGMYVADAVAWATKLRRDPRFSTLTIIGHSEGSLIGMIAARQMGADGFVSIAGAGEPAAKVLATQLKPKLPPRLYATSQAILSQLQAGKTVATVPQSLAALFRPSVQPYLISWFRYDPARELARLHTPVLILQGERDLQVAVPEARALSRADPAATLVLIAGMNHIMKDVGASERDNLRSYGEPDLPIDATLSRSIRRFILRLPRRIALRAQARDAHPRSDARNQRPRSVRPPAT